MLGMDTYDGDGIGWKDENTWDYIGLLDNMAQNRGRARMSTCIWVQVSAAYRPRPSPTGKFFKSTCSCLDSIRYLGSIADHGLYICADVPILLRVSARVKKIKNKKSFRWPAQPGSLLLSHFILPLFLVPRNEMPVFVSWLFISDTPQQVNGFVWPAGCLAGIPQADASLFAVLGELTNLLHTTSKCFSVLRM